MSLVFQYPNFLWGLLALSIPILIHLFKFRRYKKEFFSNVSILEQLRFEHKNKSKLKHILILLCRLMAILCIVLAFAQPRFVSSGQQIQKTEDKSHFSFYIDNSYSMDLSYKETTLLEYAKKEVVDMIKRLPVETPIQLITNEFTGEEQQFVSSKRAIEKVLKVEPTLAIKSLKQVYNRQKALFEASHIKSEQVERILISDFQKYSCGDWVDTAAIYIPLQPSIPVNFSLDSIELENPVIPSGGEGILQVWISTQGEFAEERTIPIRLYIDNAPISVQQIALKNNTSLKIDFPFKLTKNGFHHGELRIEDDVFSFDNEFYFTLYNPKEIRVLQIYELEKEEAISKLFAGDSTFVSEVVEKERLNYASIETSALVILDKITTLPSALRESLKGYLEQGGSVVIIPPFVQTKPQELNDWLSSMSIEGYGQLREDRIKIEDISFNHTIWQRALEKQPEKMQGVDIHLDVYFPLPKSRGLEEVLPSFLNSYPVKKGNIYLFASPWTHTDFTSSYAFVVSMLNMALEGSALSSLYFNANETAWDVYIPNEFSQSLNGETLSVRNSDFNGHDTVFYIPETRKIGGKTFLYALNYIPAGNYALYNSKTSPISAFSVNVSRLESQLVYCNTKDWKYMRVYNPNAGYFPWERASSVWKIMLIFALVFILTEILLLRKR